MLSSCQANSCWLLAQHGRRGKRALDLALTLSPISSGALEANHLILACCKTWVDHTNWDGDLFLDQDQVAGMMENNVTQIGNVNS